MQTGGKSHEASAGASEGHAPSAPSAPHRISPSVAHGKAQGAASLTPNSSSALSELHYSHPPPPHRRTCRQSSTNLQDTSSAHHRRPWGQTLWGLLLHSCLHSSWACAVQASRCAVLHTIRCPPACHPNSCPAG